MIKPQALYWWVGIIEDRDDPLKMGRVRVRIINIHTDNLSVLPTEELPWAVVMQPTTSAALSGIGTAPVGLLPGSWCVGFFIDGEEMQQPVVMGTIGGMPDPLPETQQEQANLPEELTNILRAADGSPVYDGTGNAILTQSEVNSDSIIKSTLPPLSVTQIRKLMDAIGFKESSSVAGGRQNYTAENRLGYIGKYQFGAPALATLGYVKIPVGGKLTNDILNTDSSWTGKSGVSSKAQFLRATGVQETVMFENLKFNYNVLKRKGTLSSNDTAGKVAGLLSVSHLLGSGGAIAYASGNDGKDANGTSGATYYALGARAVGDTVPLPNTPSSKIPSNVDPSSILNDSNKLIQKSFTDPDKKYPLPDYKDLPDTNKLATGIIEKTPIEKRKNTLREDVSVVTGTPWDEPPPAYSAKYPYNQTFQTEAGHLVEFDNSPGHERIHLYHKAGTYIEIDVNGTSVRKVVGDNYELVERNNYLFTRGAYKMTVEGATQILIKNKVDLQVFGDTTATFNGDLNFNVGGDYKLNVGGDMNISVGGDYTLLGSSVSLDGTPLNLNAGVSKDLGSAPSRISVEESDTTPLARPEADATPFDLDAGDPGADSIATALIEEGKVNPDQVPTEGDSVVPDENKIPAVECDCSEFQGVTHFPETLQLSRYFNLGQLSSRALVVTDKVVAQRGLAKSQIVCNLKNLAVNCLDKIKEQYPDMVVTNAFRLDKLGRVNTSDHGLGMAADLQFTARAPSDYLNIINWISSNVPYKQLLLEYGGGAKNPWIHIAFDKAGNKHTLPFATFKDHKVYARNKFINLA